MWEISLPHSYRLENWGSTEMNCPRDWSISQGLLTPKPLLCLVHSGDQRANHESVKCLTQNCWQNSATRVKLYTLLISTSQVAPAVKNPPANAGDIKRHGFGPWVRKIPWRRKWLPTPVFLPGESHGQRSLGSGVAKSWTWLNRLNTNTSTKNPKATRERERLCQELTTQIFKRQTQHPPIQHKKKKKKKFFPPNIFTTSIGKRHRAK